MIVIYHNPNSVSSKQSLGILETSKHKQEQIKYEDKILDVEKLSKIINILRVNPIELIRTDHCIWKENFQYLLDSGHQFSDVDYINIMIEYPKLIERPIIINGRKAVIGKPPKKIINII